LINKLSTILLSAWLLISAGCSSSQQNAAWIKPNQTFQRESTTGTSLPLPGSANNLDFALTNLTGATLQAIYVSPTDSRGWEENVLGNDKLQDGDTINLKFDPAERAGLWDLRVEAANGYYAEWKCIDLRTVTKITLHITLDEGAAGVAEIE
jgi:hypothetical protein